MPSYEVVVKGEGVNEGSIMLYEKVISKKAAKSLARKASKHCGHCCDIVVREVNIFGIRSSVAVFAKTASIQRKKNA